MNYVTHKNLALRQMINHSEESPSLCNTFTYISYSQRHFYHEKNNIRYLTAKESDKFAFKKHVQKLFERTSSHYLSIYDSIITTELLSFFIENVINELTIGSCYIHEPDKKSIFNLVSGINKLNFQLNGNYESKLKNGSVYDICNNRYFISTFQAEICFYSHEQPLKKLNNFFLYSNLTSLKIHTTNCFTKRLENVVMKNKNIKNLDISELTMNKNIKKAKYLETTVSVQKFGLLKLMFPSLSYANGAKRNIDFRFLAINKVENKRSQIRVTSCLMCVIIERKEGSIKNFVSQDRLFFVHNNKN